MDEEAVISAIEKITPSVVNVGTVRMLRRSMLEVVPLKGVGSGFVVGPEGLILTNAHVIEHTQEIEVALENGEKLSGQVRGADKASDIAVIQVNETGLSAAELGDSDQLRVGQGVIAIGNPLGLAGGPTVTTGVVSSLNRHIESEDLVLENLIQTDASINPGNSGGPLLDSKGKVIGVNTAIVPYAQGIGFAIPINKARTVAEDLIQYGEYRKPSLGIVGVDVTEGVARRYGLPVESGALVVRVQQGSAADRVGIDPGDVIVGADDAQIDSVGDLQRIIAQHKPGDEVEIQVNTRGLTEGVRVSLGAT